MTDETLTFPAPPGGGGALCHLGLLLVAAAGRGGLLKGYRSACHWAWRGMLESFGAEPVADRVVRDRNRISGGGSGRLIDFCADLAAELAGERVAQQISSRWSTIRIHRLPAKAVPKKAGRATASVQELFALQTDVKPPWRRRKPPDAKPHRWLPQPDRGGA